MASPKHRTGLELASVCTECFEKDDNEKAELLLQSKCLDKASHRDAISVRVSLTAEGVLEPEVRPLPKVRFKGEFVICSRAQCKGESCTFPHCLKEKAAWNADKFGVAVRVHTPHDVSSETAGFGNAAHAEEDIQQEPWPDFPGFGARTFNELQRGIETAPNTRVLPHDVPPPPLPLPFVPDEQLPSAQSPPKASSNQLMLTGPDTHLQMHTVQSLAMETGSHSAVPLLNQQREPEVESPPASQPALSYAKIVASHQQPKVPSSASILSSPPPIMQSPQKFLLRGGAMKSKIPPRTHSSGSVLEQSLQVSNYCHKFLMLLKMEERAHAKLLAERCSGDYVLHVFPSGQKPGELRVDAKFYHNRFGYLKGMGCDEVGYATQSASNAMITVGNHSLAFDILRENNFHAEERLYIAFEKEAAEKLVSHFKIGKNPFKSPAPLAIHFQLKYSYFKSLKNAVRDLKREVIARLLPSTFTPPVAPDEATFEAFQKYCSPDQFQALKVIASAPASGPPVLISGPFGTGKTRVLAIAAHYLLQQSIQKESRLGILVCTQQNTSADAYLDMYSNLTPEPKPVTVIRLIAKYTWHKYGSLCKTVEEFKKEMERDSYRNRQRYVVVTTCLTAKYIAEFLPPWFFTHIFLDEGAQMREPEAVTPLCMASQNTKLVIAGDKFQVGPAMLVLGDEPQRYGLSKSLLERLYDLYHQLGDVAKPYCAHLSTNFRCHRNILNLARQVAYKMPLECKVPDHSAHPDAVFPLQFVCTSLDANLKAIDSSVNMDEVNGALKVAANFFMKWPAHEWGKRDLKQLCFLSPCRAQVTIARGTRKMLPPQVKLMRKIPTYQIQGQEFRALFISTSEPTTLEGETRDSTKSISDPAVFITALTRAQSLVVAVGNPFMLLKGEQHMVKKYGDRGHCWSRYLKACIDNNSLFVYKPHEMSVCQPSGEENVAILKQWINKAVQHLSPEPLDIPKVPIAEVPIAIAAERAENTPSISVVPDTPTKTPTSPQSEGVQLAGSHEFQNHVMKEILGHGGFGVVCSVRYNIDQKSYALKIVRLQDKPDEQKSVMREVEALAGLEHPNIVRYYHSWKETAPSSWKDTEPWKYLPSRESVSYQSQTECSHRLTGDTESQEEALGASATTSPGISSHFSSVSASEGSSDIVEFARRSKPQSWLSPNMGPHLDLNPPVCLCIKTELCDKSTLKTWLKKHKYDRKYKEVTSFFLQMLEGVKYIHSQKLIHRDLKPSNIFFSRAATEQERKIKIGDFGLVTTVTLDEGVPSRSKYVGTTWYISPEQRKREKYGKEVDIYALGIIYFEMNCPFETDMQREKVLEKLRKGVFPKSLETDLNLEASIIEWMLTEERSSRPSAEKIISSSYVKRLKKKRKGHDTTIP